MQLDCAMFHFFSIYLNPINGAISELDFHPQQVMDFQFLPSNWHPKITTSVHSTMGLLWFAEINLHSSHPSVFNHGTTMVNVSIEIEWKHRLQALATTKKLIVYLYR